MGKRWKAVFLCLCLLTGLLSGCTATQNIPRVAVIVKSVNSDFFQKMRHGVNSAATEFQVAVTFDGPDSEEDYVAQNGMIAQAVENGVDAIVLSAIDYERSAPAVENAVRHGIKVITVDSGVRSESVKQFIGTDNRLAGRAAADAAVERPDTEKPVYIGVVSYMNDTENGKRREEGFREAIREAPNATVAASVTVESTVAAATEGALRLLEDNPEINVLVGFNEWMTLGVGEAIRQKGCAKQVRGVGFDSNISSVSMLETGEMDVLIVQNPFAMGYLGVKNAAELLNGKNLEKEVYTATVTVNVGNLYDADVQKILFRFDSETH